jgi:hypothetical protein
MQSNWLVIAEWFLSVKHLVQVSGLNQELVHLRTENSKDYYTCCAMAALRWDKIKAYYERKVLEGKNKMSVINAIRNKLLLRLFAMIRDQRPYVENYQRASA